MITPGSERVIVFCTLFPLLFFCTDSEHVGPPIFPFPRPGRKRYYISYIQAHIS